jgi:hypothetical protein
VAELNEAIAPLLEQAESAIFPQEP